MIRSIWTVQSLAAMAALGVPGIGITLWAWGQPLICTCGYVQFWVGSIFSSGNSQHIADWYTLSHIVHGMLIVLFGRLLLPKLDFRFLFAIAIITGIAWEIVEHTEWVLSKFRATTLYQGYIGDSVLNAVADYVWMMGGFAFASAVRTKYIVIAIVILEVLATVVARDSLTLTTIMVLFPIEAIDVWQQEINPNAGQIRLDRESG